MGCLMMMLCEEDSSEYAFIKKREKSLKTNSTCSLFFQTKYPNFHPLNKIKHF